MEIYLIRHTTPAVAKGICYGQTDLDVTETMQQEADAIAGVLPNNITEVFTSPLQRCTKLANYLFPKHTIELENNLKEIHCGSWEMMAWDAIPEPEITPWMQEFVHSIIPNGESYTQLFNRVVQAYNTIQQKSLKPAAIVAHGGVLRSILAYITNTPLENSFTQFQIYYGCVVRINTLNNSYEILHNIAPSTTETHKPSKY